MKTIIRTFLLLFGFAVCNLSTAQQENILPKVYHYQLKNGFQLYVKPDTRAPVVITDLFYRVGSVDEPNGITGISHVMEHMMFSGTKRYPGESYSTIISEQGGQDNAMTGSDYTQFFVKIAAAKLPLVLALEADRMQHLQMSAQAYNREIKVVREERRMRTDNNPIALTYERMNAAAFTSIPYQHPVVGWMSDLDQMQLADVQHWYDTWYGPNNAVLVIVGDVDPNKTYELVKKTFANIPSKTLPVRKDYIEQKALGIKRIKVNLPAKVPDLFLSFNVPAYVSLNEKDRWQANALLVLAGILGGDESSRLYQQLVMQQEITTNINIGYDPFSRFGTLFLIEATPADGVVIQKLEKAIFTIIKQIQTQGVTAAELQRVKNQIMAANIFQKDSMFAQAQAIGQLAMLQLPWQLAYNYPEQIAQVTAAQVKAVANQYLTLNALTIAYLNPLPIQGKNISPASVPVGAKNDIQ